MFVLSFWSSTKQHQYGTVRVLLRVPCRYEDWVLLVLIYVRLRRHHLKQSRVDVTSQKHKSVARFHGFRLFEYSVIGNSKVSIAHTEDSTTTTTAGVIIF